MDWSRTILRTLWRIERRWDALKYCLRKPRSRLHDGHVLPYRGMGNHERVWFKGRVVRERQTMYRDEFDRLWENLAAAWRRFHTREIPAARVRTRFGGQTRESLTDDEGYFEVTVPNSFPLDCEWREAEFTLLDKSRVHPELATTTGFALFPAATARFGVISDIDDTIVVSHARNIIKLAYTMLTRSARSRVPFEGVSAFYRALREGASGAECNPIFYVSSGPWNLYHFLLEFFELKQIPLGPILLQDFGLDQNKLISSPHLEHKRTQIKMIMEMYPALPFILIGDSGQHDPEIYSQVLQETGNRIRAIYIRNVTGKARAGEIARLQQDARNHGGDLRLVQDSLEAAEHAAAQGWISPDSLPHIAGQTVEDKNAPGPLHKLQLLK